MAHRRGDRVPFDDCHRLQRQAGPCFERNQAVIYLGPFKEVLDDDGHRLERGCVTPSVIKPINSTKKSLTLLLRLVDPLTPVPLESAKPFDCAGTRLRHPKETKGHDYNVTTEAGQCCDGGNGACS